MILEGLKPGIYAVFVGFYFLFTCIAAIDCLTLSYFNLQDTYTLQRSYSFSFPVSQFDGWILPQKVRSDSEAEVVFVLCKGANVAFLNQIFWDLPVEV